MTKLSSSSVDIASGFAKDDARGCAVGSDDAKRETVEIVDAGLDVAQVEPFDHDRAVAEQHVVRGRARRFEFLNGEIVDADQFDAVRNQMVRARFGDADVVGPKF